MSLHFDYLLCLPDYVSWQQPCYQVSRDLAAVTRQPAAVAAVSAFDALSMKPKLLDRTGYKQLQHRKHRDRNFHLSQPALRHRGMGRTRTDRVNKYVLGVRHKWGPIAQGYQIRRGPDLCLTPSTPVGAGSQCLRAGILNRCSDVPVGLVVHYHWGWFSVNESRVAPPYGGGWGRLKPSALSSYGRGNRGVGAGRQGGILPWPPKSPMTTVRGSFEDPLGGPLVMLRATRTDKLPEYESDTFLA